MPRDDIADMVVAVLLSDGHDGRTYTHDMAVLKRSLRALTTMDVMTWRRLAVIAAKGFVRRPGRQAPSAVAVAVARLRYGSRPDRRRARLVSSLTMWRRRSSSATSSCLTSLAV